CRDKVRHEAMILSTSQDAALRAACSTPGADCVTHLTLAKEYAGVEGVEFVAEHGLHYDWVRSFKETSSFLNTTTEGHNVRVTFSDHIVGPWARHLDGDVIQDPSLKTFLAVDPAVTNDDPITYVHARCFTPAS